ncbi:MAG: aldo/keto reductase, partial [Lysobacterales bacterium]
MSNLEMRYRRLGRTGLEVSLLGLGSGGPNQFGQLRSVPRSQVVSLVRYALDLGVNFFDTAAAYADSEEILAEALSGVPRDRYLLASKFVPT